MENSDFNMRANLTLMKEFLSCGINISLWHYGSDGHLIETTSEQLVLDRIFENTGSKAYMVANGRDFASPMILGGQLGLMWCAVSQRRDGIAASYYVIGPVFNSDISTETIEKSAQKFNVDLSWREGYIRLLRGLPVVSSILFFQYALMLHYCVTGEKLNRSDLHFQKWEKHGESPEQEEAPQIDRMQVWYAERALLNMVREGDLNYQSAIAKANLMSNGVRTGGANPTMQAIVSCTSFTSLCVRVAIQAGLSPETAYSVGDSYIQSMVACETVAELRSINHAMYEDFIMRVHRHRTNPKVSNQIQACRDYIEVHTDEVLNLGILAKRVGYSEYHLSRKFKEEMGVSISAYIKIARVERSKILLITTPDSISQIAAQLRFCSSSHFSESFRQVVGMKPQQYRQKYRRI